MSVGVKGLRLGTGPRGHYVNVGAGGIYYRASLGRAGQKAIHQSGPEPRLPYDELGAAVADVEMIEIDSGDVLAMRDENFTDLLDELNQRKRQLSIATALAIAGAILGAALLFSAGSIGAIILVLTVPAYFLGKWFDSYRRSAVLFYDLDEHIRDAYEGVTRSFDNMMACAQKWHIAAGGDIRDLTTWKRNAGASRLVDKKSTTLAYSLPSVIKSNLTPPAVHVGRQIIYFFSRCCTNRGQWTVWGYRL